MTRIIYPATVDDTIQLLADIRTRHLQLGAESPITLLLQQHSIVLADDVNTATAAQVNERTATTLRSQSENYTSLRNLKSEPALKSISGMGQVLKTFYKPDFTQVALWGIDITASGKITYPTAPTEQETLARNLQLKIASFPAGGSPLSAYISKEGIDPADLTAAFEEAIEFDTMAAQRRADSQNAIAERNAKLAPVLEHLRIIGNYLMGFYADNPRQLGLWGFVIDESTAKPTERTTKIKLLDKATINSVIIGGSLTNVGEVDVHLYKGKTTVGNPIILTPGSVFGVPKGYSTLTVSNPSPLKTAAIKVLVSN